MAVFVGSPRGSTLVRGDEAKVGCSDVDDKEELTGVSRMFDEESLLLFLLVFTLEDEKALLLCVLFEFSDMLYKACFIPKIGEETF